MQQMFSPFWDEKKITSLPIVLEISVYKNNFERAQNLARNSYIRVYIKWSGIIELKYINCIHRMYAWILHRRRYNYGTYILNHVNRSNEGLQYISYTQYHIYGYTYPNRRQKDKRFKKNLIPNYMGFIFYAQKIKMVHTWVLLLYIYIYVPTTTCSWHLILKVVIQVACTCIVCVVGLKVSTYLYIWIK